MKSTVASGIGKAVLKLRDFLIIHTDFYIEYSIFYLDSDKHHSVISEGNKPHFTLRPKVQK